MKNSQNSITVEYPYSKSYDRGYLYIESDFGDRKHVILSNSKSHIKKNIPYARYLMSVKLGRLLESNEQVFHIDGNKLNNDLSNLQIKVINKTAVKPNPANLEFKEIPCSFCQRLFIRKVCRIKEHNFCSDKCSDNFIRREKITKKRILPKYIPNHPAINKVYPINFQLHHEDTFIKVEGPFKDKYETAQLIYNKSRSPSVIKFKKIGETNYSETMFLHRYLLSIKINRILGRNEHIIYIDGNSNNKSIDNMTVKNG